MSRERHRADIVYALADYKQLVLAYKSKYAELVKRLSFWRASALWLALLSILAGLIMGFALSEIRDSLAEGKKSIDRLNGRVEAISIQLEKSQKELASAREELDKKELVIKQLEQNISNASKELLEKLLKEQ